MLAGRPATRLSLSSGRLQEDERRRNERRGWWGGGGSVFLETASVVLLSGLGMRVHGGGRGAKGICLHRRGTVFLDGKSSKRALGWLYGVLESQGDEAGER